MPLIDVSRSGVIVGRPQAIIDGLPSKLRYLYLMRRKAELTHADYLDHYFHHHSSYAFHLTGICAYTQVHVEPDASATLARRLGLGVHEIDSVTELSFDTLDGFFAGVTPEAAEVSVDELHFVDREQSVSFCTEATLVRGAA